MIRFRHSRTHLRSYLFFALEVLGVLALLGVISLGIWRSFERGGKDFDVFYHAWKLVLSGQGSQIYRESPDRFLYAPAFAWLLAPLALLPSGVSLGLWCALKVFVLGAFVWALKKSPLLEGGAKWGFGVGVWSILFVARPILIDFEYGQVNLLILGACFWGLLNHFNSKSSGVADFFSWFCLAFGALAKLYPLPLLIVPWLRSEGVPQLKLQRERAGILLCAGVMVAAPLLSQGGAGAWGLFLDWRTALMDRGLPLETHNQSFIALLYHYWSGNLTHALSEKEPLHLGFRSLSEFQIRLLSLFWSFLTSGLILAWITLVRKTSVLQWIAVAIGLLILPSHLIWKPYFVFSLPLAAWILQLGLTKEKAIGYWLLVLALFVGINFTGFDFVGHSWGAQLEAASFLLLMHLVMLGFGYFPQGRVFICKEI